MKKIQSLIWAIEVPGNQSDDIQAIVAVRECIKRLTPQGQKRVLAYLMGEIQQQLDFLKIAEEAAK